MATKLELEQENKELKTSLGEMQSQFEQMQKMMQQLMSSQPQQQVVQEKPLTSKKIKVISLIDNELNMTTEPMGQGRIFSFPKFGYEHRIKFDDLEDIVHVHRWLFEKGLAYICDHDAIVELGLEEECEAILDKKGIESIAKLESPEDVAMFKGLSKDMQEKVSDMIAKAIVNGENRDLNKLSEIQRDTGFDIQKLAQDMKEIKK
ncbi:MAG: hypothetical protein ACRCX8_15750 [Sarcina sp.]